MKLTYILRISVFLACVSLLKAEANDIDTLALPSQAAGLSALQRVLSQARNGKPEGQRELREQLKARLRQTTEPLAVQQLAAAVAPVCDDECVIMLAGRLPLTRRDGSLVLLCKSVQLLITSQSRLDPASRKYAADQLQFLAQDESQTKRVADSALLAMASMGSEGFDRLIAMFGKQHDTRLDDIYFTALAETGDIRALPVLIASLKDPRVAEGQQTQIVRGIGALIRLSRETGTVLPNSELKDAADVVRKILLARTSDQLYESAMQSLAVIDFNDPTLQAIVRDALASDTATNREGALQAIYGADSLPEPALVEYIAAMSQKDPDETVRSTASAVVDKARASRE